MGEKIKTSEGNRRWQSEKPKDVRELGIIWAKESFDKIKDQLED